MKKIIVTLGALVSFTAAVFAQDDVYPAAKQNKKTAIVGATVHVGNGQVIENGTVVFDNGKIVYAGDAAAAPKAENTIDAKGKQVYPGLILPSSTLFAMTLSRAELALSARMIAGASGRLRMLLTALTTIANS